MLAKYFAGSLLVAVLAGVYILAIGLILRVPLAPLAAVWMMVTDLIPQVGGFLGGAVFVLLGFTASPLTGVICLVLYVLYMNFENHILQPAIVGDAVNLSPPDDDARGTGRCGRARSARSDRGHADRRHREGPLHGVPLRAGQPS